MTGQVDVTTDPWTVTFPFSSKLNAAVSAVPGACWHTRRAVWLVPPSDAASALLSVLAAEHGFTVTGQLVEDGIDLATLSRSLDHDLQIPGFGLDLFGYQRAAVAYIAEARRTFLADDMGVGKTITALAALFHLSAWPAIIAVPRKLRSNWAIEARRCMPDARVAVIVSPSTPDAEAYRLIRRGVSVQESPRRGADLYIVSYSTIDRVVPDLIRLAPQALVLDESQLCKTRDRVDACRACGAEVRRGTCTGGGRHHAATVGTDRVYRVRTARSAKAIAEALPDDGVALALSGTPNKNTTSDFIAQLDILGRLTEFGGEQSFLGRYCGPTGRGGSNLLELHARLRARCYIRRTKAEVMPGLPPLLRNQLLVDLDPADRAEYDRAALDVAAECARRAAEIADRDGLDPGTAAFEARVRAEAGRHLVKIGTLLRLSAAAKVKTAVEWAEQFLAETDRKLVIFAHHQDVINGIVQRLGCPRIDGTVGDPEPVKELFQNDPGCRVIVVGVMAGGVGLTLTAASDMVFVEMAWTPADLDQAESRCYGRVNDAHGATATYLVAAGTLDEARWALIERKRVVARAAADGIVVNLAAARREAEKDLVVAAFAECVA